MLTLDYSCALLDIHRPDLIDFESLDKRDHRANMQLAFDIASKEVGIPDLLDVEDVCDVPRPDERSLMTYIAYWFHAFSQMEKVENAGRRVEKFVSNMQGAWEMQSSFERRMRDLMRQILDQGQLWEKSKFEGTYGDAKDQANEFTLYKRSQKRGWIAERSDLVNLLGNIKTKLNTYRLRPYEPPRELSIEALDKAWAALMKAEQDRSKIINETIRDIKNSLRRNFADKANDLALAINTLSTSISGLEGEVEQQLRQTQGLSSQLQPLDEYLKVIVKLDEQCEEANIEENDFTTYTYDELEYELDLVKSAVSKKLAFLENQMVARNMTNLTPIQLEEFESVFRHFDKDLSNSLQELEFSAALASLGLVYDEREMHQKFLETSKARSSVSFEQFIHFMVAETEDQNTAEQVFESFKEVADGKVRRRECRITVRKKRTRAGACRRATRSYTFFGSSGLLRYRQADFFPICYYSHTSPNLTCGTHSYPTSLLKTSRRACRLTKDLIVRMIAIFQSTIMPALWESWWRRKKRAEVRNVSMVIN